MLEVRCLAQNPLWSRVQSPGWLAQYSVACAWPPIWLCAVRENSRRVLEGVRSGTGLGEDRSIEIAIGECEVLIVVLDQHGAVIRTECEVNRCSGRGIIKDDGLRRGGNTH